MVSLLFLQGEKTKSYRTNVREMCSSSTLLKIKGTKELAYFVLFFVMLTSSSFAAPNRPYSIIDHRKEIRFHSQPCKPVDREHLRYRMGEHYDSSRMALDKKSINHNSFDERSIGNKFDNKIDDDSDDYPNDMPYFDSQFNEDELEELSNSEHTSAGEGIKDDEGSKPDQNSIKYMRRKKRKTNANFSRDDNDIDKIKSSSRNSDEKPQKRLFSDLKKFIRKSKKGKKVKKLPWTCKMKQYWDRTDDGYYPPFLYTGSCQSSKKCFYNLYDCIPKKYGVKILKREPNRCNPVPLLGNTTTYEEVWSFVNVDTTVACECGIGKSRKLRHRNRGRP